LQPSSHPGPSTVQLRVAALVGYVKTQNTMWMDGAETKTEGTAHSEWAMDGRYVISKHTGNFGGMPFQGMGIDGYDNIDAKYFSLWIDNMSTGIMFMTGKADPAGKVFTFTGEGADPMQPGKKKRMREVTTINSAEKHTSEFFESGPNGKEFNSMTIVYTKKAGGSDSPAPIKPAPAKPGNDDKTKSKDGN